MNAQNLLDAAANSEEGHAEFVLKSGLTLVVTDFAETFLLRDFRPTTAKWTEDHITFDQIAALLDADFWN